MEKFKGKVLEITGEIETPNKFKRKDLILERFNESVCIQFHPWGYDLLEGIKIGDEVEITARSRRAGSFAGTNNTVAKAVKVFA